MPQDDAEAVRLWLKDGDPRTYRPKRTLALCPAYANGRGVARDPVEAARWCLPSARAAGQELKMTPEGEAAARDFATASISVISIAEQRCENAEALAMLRSLLPEVKARAASGDAKAQSVLAEALRLSAR